MIIHKVEERRCTRRRVPSSFSHKEGTRPLCGAKTGPATVSLFASTQMFCGPAWLRQKTAPMLPRGRRTDARLGHGVVTIHSGSYWIINTLDNITFIDVNICPFVRKITNLP
ncbi:hypothetical protein [Aneurinibacillus aneurinilyticus]|uniref:hypothetical protein n=1 Tax=Aneurinibacillus aneurinilyticus TaxID=1391 RepID=UPI00352362D4